MKVKIRTKEKCSCGAKFVLTPMGLFCPKHLKSRPNRFYLDWYFQGEQFKRFGIKDFKTAFTEAGAIERDIKEFKFRPEHYKGKTAKVTKKFAFETRFDRWMALKEKEVAPSYYRKIEQYRKEFVAFFGNEDVRLINRDMIMEYYESLLGKVSVKTQYNKLGMLHTFLRDMHDREVIRDVPRFPKVKLQKRRVKWMQKDQQLTVLQKIPEQHKPVFLFLFGTGCRQAEARALHWEDLDFNSSLITIRHNFSGTELRSIPKDREERLIPMTQAVRQVLQKQPRTLHIGFVFTMKGKPYYESSLGKIWRKACDDAGVDRIPLHAGSRHSFASQLVNRGQSLEIIGEILGHADRRTTQKYAHVHVDAMRAAMECD
ncbi:tyrosine-type recombinase/integrase [Thermodesulfobacteriota bacterium]